MPAMNTNRKCDKSAQRAKTQRAAEQRDRQWRLREEQRRRQKTDEAKP